MALLAMEWLWYPLTGIGGLILGGVVGFFITRKIFTLQLQKNPPINENMLRIIYSQMGQKPSEAKIRQIMNALKNSGR